MPGTVIGIASASCALADADSRWLAEAIRSRYKEEAGPLDACARACLELAEALAAEGTRSSPPEQIRIGDLPRSAHTQHSGECSLGLGLGAGAEARGRPSLTQRLEDASASKVPTCRDFLTQAAAP
jgi:hypothetical protein